MNERTKTHEEDSAGINKVLDKILKEKQKIDRREGDIVTSLIRIGHHLAELRAATKRTWAERLKSLGINPRVAARYLKLAEYWPIEIGLNESDLLTRLPVNLLKLKWLCRLPVERLGELLDQLDCKKATRSEVIAAVRAMLGETPPVPSEASVAKFVDRCIRRLATAVDRLQEKFPAADEQCWPANSWRSASTRYWNPSSPRVSCRNTVRRPLPPVRFKRTTE